MTSAGSSKHVGLVTCQAKEHEVYKLAASFGFSFLTLLDLLNGGRVGVPEASSDAIGEMSPLHELTSEIINGVGGVANS